ncbi:hypothetical protein N8I77_001387 [Diaporthe amygdali]|uniref:DUF7735 domain-containing protein n=1 Tax=Phomopsis amygdali TaxID=1214568 RepID=A0AAD9SQU5_PHOAM|nr:hypothetical protein N8I77_001387 [Diaporthe amygdali]
MHSQLVIAALAASVSANIFPAHVPIRRDLLVARQTDSSTSPSATSGGSSDEECQAELLSIATALPIPDDDLLNWEESQTDTDPCSITDVPSSLTSQYSSYTDAVLSWYSASSSELLSALSACPQYADAASEVQVCTSSLSAEATATGSGSSASATGGSSATGSASGASGSSTGTATKSGSSGSTSSATGSASSSAATAGAPMREVGIMGAVLAGVLGAAVAL